MVPRPRLPYPRERRPQVAYPYKETRNDLLRSGAFPPLVSFFLLLLGKKANYDLFIYRYKIIRSCSIFVLLPIDYDLL